jgi:hypothetical protein
MVTEVTDDVAIIIPTPAGQKLYVISLENLAMILQRALNTHSDIPHSVLTLSDAVTELTEYINQQ